MAKLLGQKNSNSNFHNFLHGDMSNLDKLLSQKHFYHKVALQKSTTKAELQQVGFFSTQFPSLGFFIDKKVGNRKN